MPTISFNKIDTFDHVPGQFSFRTGSAQFRYCTISLFARQQRIQELTLRRQLVGINGVAISAKCCPGIAVAKHGRDGFQINSIRNHPGPEAVAQVVEVPALDGFSTRIEVANPDHFALLVPLLDSLEHPGLYCRWAEVRLARDAAATRLSTLQLGRSEDPVLRLRVHRFVLPMPKIVTEHWMKSDRGLAVNVLAVSYLLYPTSSYNDPLATVFNVYLLQPESFASAQASRGDNQSQNELRLVELLDPKRQGFHGSRHYVNVGAPECAFLQSCVENADLAGIDAGREPIKGNREVQWNGPQRIV